MAENPGVSETGVARRRGLWVWGGLVALALQPSTLWGGDPVDKADSWVSKLGPWTGGHFLRCQGGAVYPAGASGSGKRQSTALLCWVPAAAVTEHHRLGSI